MMSLRGDVCLKWLLGHVFSLQLRSCFRARFFLKSFRDHRNIEPKRNVRVTMIFTEFSVHVASP
jgi:hypothetical protein